MCDAARGATVGGVVDALAVARSWCSTAIPALLLVSGLAETLALDSSEPLVAAVALYGVVSCVIALRRRAPVVTAVAVAAANFASGPLGGIEGSITLWLAWTVAFYGLGLRVQAERRRTAIAVLVVVSAVFATTAGGKLENFLAASTVSILIPYLAGLLRQRQLHMRDLQEQTERLQREHEDAMQRVAEQERQQLARELHDIVSHTVGTIAVQAEAGDVLLDSDPAAARAAVRAIAQNARGAMVELRRLLSLLRSDDPDALRVPQPNLAALRGLVERMQGAGLDVDVRIVGRPRELPAAIELSAYRVLQEGLTNALVHSGADHASIQIAYHDDSIDLEVSDQGRGADAPFGTGLTGMRERVAMLGGDLHAGPARPGWRLVVSLPLDDRGAT
jgi:signal transduction histidine kinase